MLSKIIGFAAAVLAAAVMTSAPVGAQEEAEDEDYNVWVRIFSYTNETELSGVLFQGSVDLLTEHLDKAPGATVIHLRSTGGIAGVGFRLAELIRERGLDTYVSGECLSACTIAFLGGKNRYLHPDGRIGFHAGGFGRSFRPNQIEKAELRILNQMIVNRLAEMGVDKGFATTALTVPHRTIWFPEYEELVEAGIVTERSSGQFAFSQLGWEPTDEEISEYLASEPDYAGLADPASANHEEAVALVLDASELGWPESMLRDELGSLVSAETAASN